MVIMHVSCIPLMEIGVEVDEIVIFESDLGEGKPRENNTDCIAAFCFAERSAPMKVLKL